MLERIALLRAALAGEKLDGFILPLNDEFMGEYVPDSARRLQWLTGFTGSAGMAVVLRDKSAFFTDGRYTLQAQAEVKGFELYNSGDLVLEKWLGKQADKTVIGYDPKLHTASAINRYKHTAKTITWKDISPNPIDSLWQERPASPMGAAFIQPLAYAGESSSAKRRRIAEDITDLGADAAILTAPDSVCWLLNIRGSDVPYTPFLLCYAILYASGSVTLYVDKNRISDDVAVHLGKEVTVKPPELLVADMNALQHKHVLYDPVNSPFWFYVRLQEAGATVVEGDDPCRLPKACKNTVELDGMSQAHIHDGLAVTRFLYWLENAVIKGETLTEISVAEKLESFRTLSDAYLFPSFATISGSGPNGAIMHYHPTPASDRVLEKDSLLLVDSGGQYRQGTTDITRTVAIGMPGDAMKTHFTLVLKGHIALARAVFPEGTSGSQLDALARQYLWQAGLDYDHGTGHGVGSFLSVHEGPQRISKRGGDAALMPGMVLSNEPGYYKAGAYGIRIESLLVVKEVSAAPGRKRYFGFDTITLAPIDMRLVDKTLLATPETRWLQEYHQKVAAAHMSSLTPAEKGWLERIC